MTDPDDFGMTVRKGVRVSNKYMVVHYRTDERIVATPLVGFVVPKKQLANAVDRNKVKRKLRHLMAERVNNLEPNTRIVIRVLKNSKDQESTVLAKALDLALKKAKEKNDNKDSGLGTHKDN